MSNVKSINAIRIKSNNKKKKDQLVMKVESLYPISYDVISIINDDNNINDNNVFKNINL